MELSEDVLMELEALESIYGEDYEKTDDGVRIHLVPNQDGRDNFVMLDLCVSFVPNYPNELPTVTFEETENISDEQEDDIQNIVKTSGEECLGMPMIYNIAAAVQNWLSDNNVNPEDIRKLAAQKAEEELQKKRQDGTPVTKETFTVWREKFYSRYLADERREEEERRRRPTGRQLFESNADLANSDASFFEEEGGENVEVDWSVFSSFLMSLRCTLCEEFGALHALILDDPPNMQRIALLIVLACLFAHANGQLEVDGLTEGGFTLIWRADQNCPRGEYQVKLIGNGPSAMGSTPSCSPVDISSSLTRLIGASKRGYNQAYQCESNDMENLVATVMCGEKEDESVLHHLGRRQATVDTSTTASTTDTTFSSSSSSDVLASTTSSTSMMDTTSSTSSSEDVTSTTSSTVSPSSVDTDPSTSSTAASTSSDNSISTSTSSTVTPPFETSSSSSSTITAATDGLVSSTSSTSSVESSTSSTISSSTDHLAASSTTSSSSSSTSATIDTTSSTSSLAFIISETDTTSSTSSTSSSSSKTLFINHISGHIFRDNFQFDRNDVLNGHKFVYELIGQLIFQRSRPELHLIIDRVNVLNRDDIIDIINGVHVFNILHHFDGYNINGIPSTSSTESTSSTSSTEPSSIDSTVYIFHGVHIINRVYILHGVHINRIQVINRIHIFHGVHINRIHVVNRVYIFHGVHINRIQVINRIHIFHGVHINRIHVVNRVYIFHGVHVINRVYILHRVHIINRIHVVNRVYIFHGVHVINRVYVFHGVHIINRIHVIIRNHRCLYLLYLGFVLVRIFQHPVHLIIVIIFIITIAFDGNSHHFCSHGQLHLLQGHSFSASQHLTSVVTSSSSTRHLDRACGSDGQS
ncbi:hypothetical protein PROFUN_16175, partial [Planoprotostelium fungivorum]